MIHVGKLPPGDQWDQTLLDQLLDGTLHPHGLDTRHHLGYPQSDGCVLVVPGRYWAGHEAEISEACEAYRWLLLIRSGDEEDLFDIRAIKHPNVKFWVQTPRIDRDYGDARLFGVGYTPHFTDLPSEPNHKPLDVFLAAQRTHQRRQECFDALQPGKSRTIIATAGFTQGLEHGEYAEQMVRAKVAPCPSGPASPDSFRVYEALQAHCVPIVDDITPGYDSRGYWRRLFPDVPFPVLTNYSDLSGYVEDQLRLWPANANRIAAWWMRKRRAMSHWLVDDLTALGAL
jgi:hypothetical protein